MFQVIDLISFHSRFIKIRVVEVAVADGDIGKAVEGIGASTREVDLSDPARLKGSDLVLF